MEQNKWIKKETKEEIHKAIGKLNGYPSEWYKTSEKELSSLLRSSFNWNMTKDTVPHLVEKCNNHIYQHIDF